MSTSPNEPQPQPQVQQDEQQEPLAAAAPASQQREAPADAAALLKQTFPALFGGGAKPLKLRIQADIQERAPGVFTKQALSAFLRRYTGGTSYLVALTKARHRFDLDGNPAGEITEEHRKVAADELARRRANRQARDQLEEEQRRNRAALLRDFERTTLTPANFCALKGVAPEELDGLLELARREAQERPPMEPRRAFDDRRGPRSRPGSPPQERRADRRPGQDKPSSSGGGRGGDDRPSPAQGHKGKQAR
ncbi:ProQ/FINO family protein [Methylibium rhizosphaerae]|uniref:ProQ/FINO family protein n=1 Tax=Methylibium rhizosphaerae TaxID=2570323 RepID=UPI00112EAF99|nr:ProQ/FinO family protein [Methylibium rhizosphaerae]